MHLNCRPAGRAEPRYPSHWMPLRSGCPIAPNRMTRRRSAPSHRTIHKSPRRRLAAIRLPCNRRWHPEGLPLIRQDIQTYRRRFPMATSPSLCTARRACLLQALSPEAWRQSGHSMEHTRPTTCRRHPETCIFLAIPARIGRRRRAPTAWGEALAVTNRRFSRRRPLISRTVSSSSRTPAPGSEPLCLTRWR